MNLKNLKARLICMIRGHDRHGVEYPHPIPLYPDEKFIETRCKRCNCRFGLRSYDRYVELIKKYPPPPRKAKSDKLKIKNMAILIELTTLKKKVILVTDPYKYGGYKPGKEGIFKFNNGWHITKCIGLLGIININTFFAEDDYPIDPIEALNTAVEAEGFYLVNPLGEDPEFNMAFGWTKQAKIEADWQKYQDRLLDLDTTWVFVDELDVTINPLIMHKPYSLD